MLENLRIVLNCGIDHIVCVVEEIEKENVMMMYVNGENRDSIKFFGNKNELFDVANCAKTLMEMNGFV